MAVRSLLRRGANANDRNEAGRTPLWFCGWQNLASVMELLVDFGGDVNVCDLDGDSPLAAAARNGSRDAFKFLLMRADVNLVNADGQSALWQAARQGHADLVSLLEKADATLRDARGRDALWIASYEGHAKVVEVLLNREDASVDNMSKQWTFLHAAADQGHSDVLKVALSFKKTLRHLDAKDSDGRTPLWLAARQGDLRSIRSLLQAGASKTNPASSGREPVDIARLHQHHSAADLIHSYQEETTKRKRALAFKGTLPTTSSS